MEKIKLAGLRALLLFAVLSTFVTIKNIATEKPAAYASECGNCGTVTDQQIITYMNNHGYTVYSINAISGSCDKRVDTQNCYDTKVIICNGSIIGHEDFPNSMCELKNSGGDVKNI